VLELLQSHLLDEQPARSSSRKGTWNQHSGKLAQSLPILGQEPFNKKWQGPLALPLGKTKLTGLKEGGGGPQGGLLNPTRGDLLLTPLRP
jgi:hypothetical protein